MKEVNKKAFDGLLRLFVIFFLTRPHVWATTKVWIKAGGAVALMRAGGKFDGNDEPGRQIVPLARRLYVPHRAICPKLRTY